MAEHFKFIAKWEGFPIGAPVEYDYSQYLHQVPGGMISNLRHQLRLVKMEDRMGETLEEASRVRADFGYPIMVTPLSQFVGSQAAINVISGERYKEVTDQVIHYTLGRWGKEAGSSMDPNVKDRILSRHRAKELARQEPPELSIEDVRRKLGGPGVSDEELLLRWVVRKEEIEVMRAAPPPKEYFTHKRSLITLMEEISKRTDRNQIQVQQHGVSLTLKRGSSQQRTHG